MANHAKTKTPLPTPAQFAEAKDAANLQVLRRLDSSIAKIHATSSHAVVYRFDQSAGNGSWVKYNVEGVLFIIERNTVNASLPKYALFVMNRAGLDNFDYPIQSKSCVMLKGEYIMCQPSASSSKHDGFFGLWVYEQSDRDRIVALVKQLLGAKHAATATVPAPATTVDTVIPEDKAVISPNVQATASTMSTNVTNAPNVADGKNANPLMNMLLQAKSRANTTASEEQPPASATPTEPASEPETLTQRLLKAKNASVAGNGTATATTATSTTATSTTAAPAPAATPTSGSSLMDMLHRAQQNQQREKSPEPAPSPSAKVNHLSALLANMKAASPVPQSGDQSKPQQQQRSTSATPLNGPLMGQSRPQSRLRQSPMLPPNVPTPPAHIHEGKPLSPLHQQPQQPGQPVLPAPEQQHQQPEHAQPAAPMPIHPPHPHLTAMSPPVGQSSPGMPMFSPNGSAVPGASYSPYGQPMPPYHMYPHQPHQQGFTPPPPWMAAGMPPMHPHQQHQHQQQQQQQFAPGPSADINALRERLIIARLAKPPAPASMLPSQQMTRSQFQDAIIKLLQTDVSVTDMLYAVYLEQKARN